MALQDLTPQLRTRLSRVERAVGWFVFLATALLVAGFAYYVYHTAQRKGWFTPKVNYQTSLNNAAGLKVGDPVKLMGFNAGEITAIIPNAPDAWYGVTINFAVLKPHYGYIWDDSQVKVSSDLLGNRFLEITKGQWGGVPTVRESTNRAPQGILLTKLLQAAREKIVAATRAANRDLESTNRAKFNSLVGYELCRAALVEPQTFYTNLNHTYWLAPEETAALNERLERVASQIEQALPNVLDLTNRINAALDNATLLTSNLNVTAVKVQPLITSLTNITAQLNGPGTLGEWLIPTNVNRSLDRSLGRVESAMATVDTNLPTLFAELTASLENLSAITSNLNVQVQANPTILSNLSRTVVDADEMVQGLKRHWLLRSAFKTNVPAKPKK
jgi:ABC-type transporter Mla subunit MlaD